MKNALDPGIDYQWVAGSGGSFHPKAVKGYNGAEAHRVCRASHRGGLHPGKLIPSSGACFIGWGGKEYGHQHYQVLVRHGAPGTY